jgi:PAS domain-containing protein
MTTSGGRRQSLLPATAVRWLASVLPMLAGRTERDRPKPLYLPAADLGSSAGIKDHGSGGDGVLLCPIFLSTDPPGDPPAGVLALIGGQRSLEVRWPSVQILVSEARLAMERILLTQQRVKRQSEELFKELIQDTSDAILIIDDDDTVRYASPAASAIFGDVPIVGTPTGRLAAVTDTEWNRESPSADVVGGSHSGFSE